MKTMELLNTRNIPRVEMEDIEEVFWFYDMKGDSKIAASQIGNCIRSLNLQPTEALIKRMTSRWKDDPESRVSIEEFVPIYENIKKEAGKAPNFKQFQNLLSYFDHEGSGNVKLHDLRQMLQNLGEKMSTQEVDLLFENVEIIDGKVSINDLIRTIMSRESTI